MSMILKERELRSSKATSQQRRAANPLKSVWVEASAGTGKTKVLSDRVLRLLLSGVSPLRVLCLTYTKAAAVEMSSRIAGRLARFSVISDEELDKELKALLGEMPLDKEEYKRLVDTARRLFAVLLDTPGGMKIQTIHSFCQEVLKRFPLEAKISPYFEVMDERASKEALDEIKKKLLDKIEKDPLSKDAAALSYLTSRVSEFVFPKIMSSIAFYRNKILKLFETKTIEELIDDLSKKLDVLADDTEEGIFEEFVKNIDLSRIRRVIKVMLEGGKRDTDRALKMESFLDKGCHKRFFEEYKKAFVTKYEVGKAVVSANPFVVEDISFEANRIVCMEEKILSLKLLKSTGAVLVLAEEMIKGYGNFKLVNSKMDYEDLIVLTKELLERRGVADWVLYKLDGGIDHVLIDEAQDTSPNQWSIVKALTEDFFSGNNARTIFAVGDKKQSIYSFQGADVREFEKTKEHFKNKVKEFEEVRLDVSFRSTQAVMDIVNEVFLGSKLSGVAMEEPHQPFRIGEAGRVEFWNVVEPIEGENPDVWKKPVERVVGDSTSSRLAKEIAKRIANMVLSKEVLESKGRVVRFSDFLVLVQRRNSFVEELVREFKNAGVNVAGVDKIKLLEQIAVEDLIALGKFVLLPTDDLILATILKSPLFGLDDKDLFELCYDRGESTLWKVLGKADKYADVYARLQKLLNMADFVRPFEFYSFVLNKLGGRKKFVERMGLEVEDGLDEFMNLALVFEAEHIPSMQLFVDWISKDEVEIKRELEQSDNDAVRIMTVHGSKGLQAPVVIIPDTVRVPLKSKGIGMMWEDLMYFPLSSAEFDKNCEKIFENEKMLMEDEYRRLLYVALTRAEDRLYVCGYQKKQKPTDKSWYEVVGSNMNNMKELIKEDEKIYYQTEQEIEIKSEKKKKEVGKIEVKPYWVSEDAKEEGALSKPLSPSKIEEADDELAVSPLIKGAKNTYLRGQIIHKLLQFVADAKLSDKELAVREFVLNNCPEIDDKELEGIVKEVMRLVNDEKFRIVFDENSRAEVSVMGMVDDKIVSAQLDRVVIKDNEVFIFDYKTNRPAASKIDEVASAYIKQMNVYKKLMEKIYPDKKVSGYIVWTNTFNIMQVN